MLLRSYEYGRGVVRLWNTPPVSSVTRYWPGVARPKATAPIFWGVLYFLGPPFVSTSMHISRFYDSSDCICCFSWFLLSLVFCREISLFNFWNLGYMYICEIGVRLSFSLRVIFHFVLLSIRFQIWVCGWRSSVCWGAPILNALIMSEADAICVRNSTHRLASPVILY